MTRFRLTVGFKMKKFFDDIKELVFWSLEDRNGSLWDYPNSPLLGPGLLQAYLDTEKI